MGPLAGDTGDVHTLQGVEMDLPYLDGRRQPAIPARQKTLAASRGMAVLTHEPGRGRGRGPRGTAASLLQPLPILSTRLSGGTGA